MRRVILKIAQPSESVVYPSFSPDGRELAVATSKGTTLMKLIRGDVMTSSSSSLSAPPRSFCLTEPKPPETAGFVATAAEYYNLPAGFEEEIQLWPQDGRGISRQITSNSSGRMEPPTTGLAAHPQLPLLAHSGGYRLSLVNTANACIVRSIDELSVSSLCFGRDGSRLWGVRDEVEVVSWSTEDLRAVSHWNDQGRHALKGRVGIPCLAAGSRWVVAVSRSGRVYVLRASDGQASVIHQASGPLACIDLSPDESMIACGYVTSGLTILERASGRLIANIAAGQEAINSVAFSPDGKLLATGATDRTISLWKVASGTPEELVRIPSPSNRPILSVQFHRSRPLLGVLIQGEHGVRLWRLDRLKARLSEHGLDWD